MVHFKVAVSNQLYQVINTRSPYLIENFWELMYSRINQTTDLYLVDNKYSQKINGTWKGIVGALDKGHVDVSLFPEIYDAEIAEVVGMQYISYMKSIGILGPEKYSESVQDVTGVLYETEVKVWVLMALVILIVTLFNKITTVLMSKAQGKESMTQDNNWLTLFGLMLYYGSSRSPKNLSSRILLTFFVFSAMIFVCYLYADMKTNVTVIRPKIYRTIRDLLKDELINVVFWDGKSSAPLFQNSPKEEYQELWKKVYNYDLQNYDLHFGTSSPIKTSYEMLKTNHIFVAGMSIMNAIAYIMCLEFNHDFILVEYQLECMFHYFLHKKNLEPEKKLYLRKISRRIAETGLVYRMIQGLNGEIPECAKKSGEPTEVEVESLMLVFLSRAGVVWAIGILASAFCLATEIVIHKFRPACRSCPLQSSNEFAENDAHTQRFFRHVSHKFMQDE